MLTVEKKKSINGALAGKIKSMRVENNQIVLTSTTNHTLILTKKSECPAELSVEDLHTGMGIHATGRWIGDNLFVTHWSRLD